MNEKSDAGDGRVAFNLYGYLRMGSLEIKGLTWDDGDGYGDGLAKSGRGILNGGQLTDGHGYGPQPVGMEHP